MGFDYSKTIVHCLLGDVCAEEHGGGIVFTGDHGPELHYTHGVESDAPDFDPEYDNHAACKLEVYNVKLFHTAEEFLSWYGWIDWEAVARSSGVEAFIDDLRAVLSTVEGRASAIEAAAGHCGWHQFDEQPMVWSYAEVDEWYEAWRVQHNARAATTEVG